VVLLVWGSWLLAVTAVQLVFAPKAIQIAIPLAAAAACLDGGLVIWRLDARRAGREPPRLLTDGSVATATLAVGLAVLLVGAGFGLWLMLIGAGVAALGLGGVVREQRARRARRVAR
jgi:hypothetical protein